ncbi:MAG TPA: hypothetical protein VFK89_05205 [Actinomycetota bacterium]|nr:hypothetical protein [Actinomycetota bacterium]
MSPFVELMQAAALIMLLFAAVLMGVVLRNAENRDLKVRLGPVVIGLSLILFAVPIYAAVLGSVTFDRYSSLARGAAAILLPVGLYLLVPLRSAMPGRSDAQTHEEAREHHDD